MAEQQPTFGAQLRIYREAAGLSQEDLAERANLSAAAIGALERGDRRRPYPHTVQLLATALGLDEARRAALIATIPARGPGASRRPPAATSATTPASPFVGRTQELTALGDEWAAAVAGRGGVVMLVGEAGIGKSRLAREFASHAGGQGAILLWGRCFEGDWQPPYGPWAEVLRTYALDRDAETRRAELGSLRASLLARLLPEIDGPLAEVPVLGHLSPADARYRVHDMVVRVLLTITGERPMVVVLDDLHWADPDSLLLLRHVARFAERAPLLLLGIYREPEAGLTDQHPLAATLAALEHEGGYRRIALQGFNRDEMEAYLDQAAGRPLSQVLVKAIEEETSGNPFYARELLRHLTDEAAAGRLAADWSNVDPRALGVPRGARQVIGQRVARLTTTTAELLRLAACLSGDFGFDLLRAASDSSEEDLLNALDEAIDAGLIRVHSPTPPRYNFAHAIVRHALYEGMNLDRRARLHRRIAVALEEINAGHEADGAGELALQYHASAALAGAERGLHWALVAAAQAEHAYAHGRVATLLEIARDLARDASPSQRADICCRLAIAQAEAGRLDDARQSADAALDAMGAAGTEPQAQVAFLATIARALKDGGAGPATWEPLVARGLALAGGTRDLAWARVALLQDRFETVRSGPISGGNWIGLDPQAVAIARGRGDEEDYARTLEPLEWRSRRDTENVLSLAASWTRPAAIGRALDVAGRDLLYRHGAFREARVVYEQLLALSERVGSIPGQGEALTQIATSDVAIGELAVARETAGQAYDAIAALGPGHRLHFAATGLAFILAYFIEGDWPGLAAATAGHATDAATSRSPLGILAASFAALSSVRAGSKALARDMIQHFASAVEGAAPTSYMSATGVPIAATAVWELEAADLAAAFRRLLLESLEADLGDHIYGPRELGVARMAALLGDFTQAEDGFADVRRTLDARGFTHVRALADYDEALTLTRAGSVDRPRVQSLLDGALVAFRSHGMSGWAERAEALIVSANRRR